jgi:hypothetical protein
MALIPNTLSVHYCNEKRSTLLIESAIVKRRKILVQVYLSPFLSWVSEDKFIDDSACPVLIFDLLFI